MLIPFLPAKVFVFQEIGKKKILADLFIKLAYIFVCIFPKKSNNCFGTFWALWLLPVNITKEGKKRKFPI